MPRALYWRLRALVYAGDVDTAEFAGATLLVLWGLFLMLPQPSLHGNRNFDSMIALAPEWAWAFLYGAIGVVQFMGIRVRRLDLRRTVALAGGWLWLVVTISLAQNTLYLPPAEIFYAFAGTVQLWIAWRLGRR